MAERFKATVLKTVVDASPPWVRIPLSPPKQTTRGLISEFRPLNSEYNGEMAEWPKAPHC